MAAGKTFLLDIVTPDRTVFSEPVLSLTFPLLDGSAGVLVNHAPMIGVLKPGMVSLRQEGGASRSWVIGGGFVEVSREKTVLLPDSLETPEEIDASRARDSFERANARLRNPSSNVDRRRAQMAMERAQARLRATSQPTSH